MLRKEKFTRAEFEPTVKRAGALQLSYLNNNKLSYKPYGLVDFFLFFFLFSERAPTLSGPLNKTHQIEINKEVTKWSINNKNLVFVHLTLIMK